MFNNQNHYRLWKLVEKSMKKPSGTRFSYLLNRYSGSLRHHRDAMGFAYYIALHGSREHLETALALLASPKDFHKSSAQHEIASFLKALTVALWYIPALAVEKVTYAHYYFLEKELSPQAA